MLSLIRDPHGSAALPELDMPDQPFEPRPFDPQRGEGEPHPLRLRRDLPREEPIRGDDILLGLQMGNLIQAVVFGSLNPVKR